MFQLTDDYKIGISQIDDEHAYLVQLINDAMELKSEENADYGKLTGDIINRLRDYASTHFVHEEAYMEKIKDPELAIQKKEHAAFIRWLDSVSTDDDMKAADVERIMEHMVRWLFNHILSSDMMIGKMEPVDGNDDPFAFTKQYETGIEFIDEQHKTLFDIIRQTNDLVHAEFLHDKYDEILGILDKLKLYTENHFHDEEEYMQKIGYPGFESQKAAHTAFIEKLVHVSLNELDEIDDNQQQYLLELICYLVDWLSNHILHADKKISEWIKESDLN